MPNLKVRHSGELISLHLYKIDLQKDSQNHRRFSECANSDSGFTL
jgi:hypothetical protein